MSARTCFKVVSQVDKGDYTSITTDPEWRIVYRVGETALPHEGSYLFLFADARMARAYAETMRPWHKRGKFVILECGFAVYTGKRIERVPYVAQMFADFWQNPHQFAEKNLTQVVPNGTVLARSVMPIKVIA